MLTISKLKIEFVKFKVALTVSIRKKEGYYHSVEELAFQSVSEENIFIFLKNKWSEIQWIFAAAGAMLGIIYAFKNILS
jgi:hypothetical protein